jgi:hypothetical protein
LISGSGSGGAQLEPIHAQEVFPSVSSRAPGRARATLWTTTNRAFTVDPDLALQALSQIAARSNGDVLHLRFAEGQSELSYSSRVAPVEGLIHQLTELVGREMHDARRLVGDGAWLKTGMDWRS